MSRIGRTASRPRHPRLQLEPFAIVLLLLSIAGHGVAFAGLRIIIPEGAIQFGSEAEILTILTLSLAIAGALVPNRNQFRGTVYARVAILFVILRILGTEGYAVRVLLAALIAIDIGAYHRRRDAIFDISIVAAVAMVNEIWLAVQVADGVTALQVAGLALIVTVTGGGAVSLTGLRERAVRDERSIRDLNAALDRLSVTNLGLQSYAANAQAESAAAERSRITRELHDSIGYAMTNIAMTMNAAKVLSRKSRDPVLEGLLDNSRTVAQECLRETRSTLYRLRSIIEAHSTGLNALAHLAKVYQDATGVEVRVEYQNARKSYGMLVDETVYRLVQEGLTNAFRHNTAEVSRTRVILYDDGNSLIVRIWDNGGGTGPIREGIGFKGMRERLAEVGGQLSYENSVHGFEICATIPTRTGAKAGTDQSAHRG